MIFPQFVAATINKLTVEIQNCYWILHIFSISIIKIFIDCREENESNLDKLTWWLFNLLQNCWAFADEENVYGLIKRCVWASATGSYWWGQISYILDLYLVHKSEVIQINLFLQKDLKQSHFQYFIGRLSTRSIKIRSSQ
jgi:hypothetical protein